MRVVSLASGSKGNSTFIQSKKANILIDDGLSLMDLEKRLKKIDVDPNSIDAILLTHEHIDHIKGVKFFLKKHRNTKVYIPSFVKDLCIPTISSFPSGQIEWFEHPKFKLKDVRICCFVLPHDSNFCVGYSLYLGNKKISIATDLGYVAPSVLKNLAGSDILFFESNHDEGLLLQNPKYPPKTKRRILSEVGHLSNVACGEAIATLAKTGVSQVVLSHLSEENNTPQLAYTTVKNILLKYGIKEGENLCVDVAFQNHIGTIFTL